MQWLHAESFFGTIVEINKEELRAPAGGSATQTQVRTRIMRRKGVREGTGIHSAHCDDVQVSLMRA